MALPDCCAAAQARLSEGGYEAAKAYVKALREHSDRKHDGYETPAQTASALTSASKK